MARMKPGVGLRVLASMVAQAISPLPRMPSACAEWPPHFRLLPLLPCGNSLRWRGGHEPGPIHSPAPLAAGSPHPLPTSPRAPRRRLRMPTALRPRSPWRPGTSRRRRPCWPGMRRGSASAWGRPARCVAGHSGLSARACGWRPWPVTISRKWPAFSAISNARTWFRRRDRQPQRRRTGTPNWMLRRPGGFPGMRVPLPAPPPRHPDRLPPGAKGVIQQYPRYPTLRSFLGNLPVF